MSFEEIMRQILSSRPDLTRAEVLKMVEKKEKEAKGFLTNESAARSIAAELGVELPETFSRMGGSIHLNSPE